MLHPKRLAKRCKPTGALLVMEETEAGDTGALAEYK
jgi:hypothetical protein